MPTRFQMLAQCTRLDISHKKYTTTFKFAHDLPVAVFYPMIFAKKIFFQPEVFFFEFTNFKIHPFFLEVCKFEKKYFWLEIYFLRIHSHRIPRQVGRVQI